MWLLRSHRATINTPDPVSTLRCAVDQTAFVILHVPVTQNRTRMLFRHCSPLNLLLLHLIPLAPTTVFTYSKVYFFFFLWGEGRKRESKRGRERYFDRVLPCHDPCSQLGSQVHASVLTVFSAWPRTQTGAIRVGPALCNRTPLPAPLQLGPKVYSCHTNALQNFKSNNDRLLIA